MVFTWAEHLNLILYKWWTEIDPKKKLDTFRRNNLNFKIIYPDGLIIDK